MDLKKIAKEIMPYIAIILAVIIIRSFVITPVRVDGISMVPTLNDGNIMLLKKFGDINRFDIVVIDYKEERLIKRVYGLPGDKIKVVNNEIYINDEKIEDSYGNGDTGDFDELTVAENEYFVLGDNREPSKDSRYLGTMNKKDIKGKVIKFVIFPFKNWGSVK